MAAMPAATIYPQSHVGFDSITSQIERKLLKRGFQFNVICVGELCSVLFSSNQSRLSSRGRLGSRSEGLFVVIDQEDLLKAICTKYRSDWSG